MALDNYANLKQYIKRWSHREDVVQDIVEDCILKTEQELFYGQTPFRLPEMITQDITTGVSTKTLPYPSNFLELINVSIEIDGEFRRLKSIPIQQIPDSSREQVPTAYAMRNGFIFDSTPDKGYNIKVEYYEKPVALSDDNATNIILQKYPNAYAFGGVAMAMEWAGETDRMNEYVIRMRDVIARANSDADNLLYGSLPSQFVIGSAP